MQSIRMGCCLCQNSLPVLAARKVWGFTKLVDTACLHVRCIDNCLTRKAQIRNDNVDEEGAM